MKVINRTFDVLDEHIFESESQLNIVGKKEKFPTKHKNCTGFYELYGVNKTIYTISFLMRRENKISYVIEWGRIWNILGRNQS